MATRSLSRLAFLLAFVAVVSLAPPAARAATPGACSARAPNGLPANAWNAARHELAPRGPAAVRLCWYSSLNAPRHGGLSTSTVVTSPSIVQVLVTRFDALRPVPTGVFNCPMDDGQAIVAHLAYPGGHGVTILLHQSGCLNALNGDLDKALPGAAGQRLTALLKRLRADA